MGIISKKLYSVVVFSMAVLLCCARANGQVTGSFSGTVTDKSGAVVAGATVVATSQGTGIARDTQTDEVGHYVINLLPVGIYTLRVESQGFQPAETKDLKLQVDERRELDFTLAPGTVSTSVEVSATQVAVETANPTLGQVITSQQVAQLPLNGRDFVQLATLTPGTTAETNPNSFFTSSATSEVAARGPFSLSVGGSRPNSTDWLIDGVDNNELTAGGIAILSSIDSISVMTQASISSKPEMRHWDRAAASAHSEACPRRLETIFNTPVRSRQTSAFTPGTPRAARCIREMDRKSRSVSSPRLRSTYVRKKRLPFSVARRASSRAQ